MRVKGSQKAAFLFYKARKPRVGEKQGRRTLHQPAHPGCTTHRYLPLQSKTFFQLFMLDGAANALYAVGMKPAENVITSRPCILAAAAIFLSAVLLLYSCAGSNDRKVIAAEYYNIANEYAENNNFDKASRYYRKAISYDPSLEPAVYNLARVYIEAGQLDTAKEHVLALLDKDPANVKLKKTLAYIYVKQKKPEKAVELYNEIIENSPGDGDVHYNLAILLWKLKENDKAKEHFEALIELQPDTKKNLIAYSEFLKEDRQWNKIIELLSATASQNTVDTTILSLLAEAHAGIESFSEAVQYYERIYNIQKEEESVDPEIPFTISELLLTAMEDYYKGMDFLQIAIENGFSDQNRIRNLVGKKSLVKKEIVIEYLKQKGVYTK